MGLGFLVVWDDDWIFGYKLLVGTAVDAGNVAHNSCDSQTSWGLQALLGQQYV